MCPRGRSGRPWDGRVPVRLEGGTQRRRVGSSTRPRREVTRDSGLGTARSVTSFLDAWGRCGRCLPSPTRMPAPRRRGRGPTCGPVEVHLGANVGLREGCRDAKRRARLRTESDRNQVQNGVAHRRLPIGPTSPLGLSAVRRTCLVRTKAPYASRRRSSTRPRPRPACLHSSSVVLCGGRSDPHVEV